MEPKAATLVEVVLDRPADEEAFLAWWTDATALLRARGRLARARLAVVGRGKYAISWEFPLPGSFKLTAEDRPWQELEARRPPAHVEIREARLYEREGASIDITTSEMVRWLAERARGERDFVLIDALKPAAFAEKHLPGAVNLPADTIVAENAEQTIGAKDRTVV